MATNEVGHGRSSCLLIHICFFLIIHSSFNEGEKGVLIVMFITSTLAADGDRAPCASVLKPFGYTPRSALMIPLQRQSSLCGID